ncbi:hypothetical protein [Micromonospora sp. HUAS LYJ1]|uniref:hypothetical protein n=1 Tax=Micromonospora sp. HUAS LYJ1 TaxID=3061626 RepID=UPI0026719C9E|nr:hypothetical protein [Micromonospora sp. HUAS LYJ1]WKU02992.1 hypothetical protein Q2K16_19060 [Micromonospora sp. HUAS LYJ1]
MPLTERDRALCLIRQAQGHALQGGQTCSLAAINTAHRLVDRAADVGEDDPDTIGRHCTPAHLRAYEDYCLLRLGLVGPATRTLRNILEGARRDGDLAEVGGVDVRGTVSQRVGQLNQQTQALLQSARV